MSQYRESHIHRRAKDFGFPGLAEYLAQRWVREGLSVRAIAEECDVRENTVRNHLDRYGFDIRRHDGSRRRNSKQPRKGHCLVCNDCGTSRYYSPAQLKNLNSSTYLCRECHIKKVRKPLSLPDAD